jgi:replication-associated recombination protein RarA
MNNYLELTQRCNGSFVPKSIDDFIGDGATKTGIGARLAATELQSAVQLARSANCAPLKFLLNGHPGIGKSALVRYLQHLVGCDKFTTTKKNGTQIKIELVEDLAGAIGLTSMFGDYQMLWIDEAEPSAMSNQAQVRLLSLLDDLPNGWVFACTSNCKVSEFEPRFQTRFQVIEIAPPTADEIQSLLNRFVDARTAQQIATFACGNVRAALLDAQRAVQARPSAAAAVPYGWVAEPTGRLVPA